MKEYVKKVENQSAVALIVPAVVFALVFALQCLYLFTDIIAAPDLGSWAMYVAVFLPVHRIWREMLIQTAL